MIRLFVGIAPSREVREKLAAIGFGIQGARWVPEENLHVTLRFIGDVDEATADALHDALLGVRAHGFAMTLSGIGTFGRGRAPHTLWIGATPSPPLMELHERVDSALMRAGLESEGRKYAPHMTLAGLRDPNQERLHQFIAGHNLLRFEFEVREFVLFSSQLGHGDPVYTAEAEYELPMN